MQYLTPSNVLIGLLAFVVVIGLIGLAWWIHMARDRAAIWAWIILALPRILMHKPPEDGRGWARGLAGGDEEKAVEVNPPIVGAAGWLRGIRRIMGNSTNLADIPDDEVLMEIDVPEPESEEAVEIIPPVEFGPITLETALMVMRLTYPRLFADNWYEQSRRDFSIWAVEMAQKRARYRRRMGLAT